MFLWQRQQEAVDGRRRYLRELLALDERPYLTEYEPACRILLGQACRFGDILRDRPQVLDALLQHGAEDRGVGGGEPAERERALNLAVVQLRRRAHVQSTGERRPSPRCRER